MVVGRIGGAWPHRGNAALRQRVEQLRHTLHRYNRVLFVRRRRRHTGLVVRVGRAGALVQFRLGDRDVVRRVPFEAILRVLNE